MSSTLRIEPSMLYGADNALARHYSRFRVSARLLLTGHSHQAWPDVGFEAQQRAWLDAAEHVDEKWSRAEEHASRVKAGYMRLLGDVEGDLALGQNTHELVTRLLSALPLGARPRLVTTDGEFHSLRRQLDRLAEVGLEIVRIPARPVRSVAERMAAAVDDRTAGALVSSVFYETAEIVPHLDAVALACARRGAMLLVDAYHHLNVVPFKLREMGLEEAFVTGGGYKYCQLGEGNAFLRIPPHCSLRPVLTGWFSEFADRDQPAELGRVQYARGAASFAGATYDPTSHYRAAAVFDFHAQMGLTPALLREVSLHQVGLLQAAFEALDVDPAIAHVEPIPADERAGFLALRSPQARHLSDALRARGVLTDARGTLLRLGPAPYLSDGQLHDAVARLGEVISR
jgi:kynureninase